MAKRAAAKTTTFGQDIIKALTEAAEHAQGNRPDMRVTHFDQPAIAVKSIRQKLALTQEQFAHLLGISPSGLRKWEQNQRTPVGAARTLLQIMDREPKAVVRALSAQE